MTVEERFWAKVDKSGDCWLWLGSRNNYGYGEFFWNGRFRATAAALILAGTEVPEGMLVLHRCDNPPCVRPDHLFLGTNADNAADKAAKGRAITPRGSANPRARFTESQIVAIRLAHAAGATQGELARQHGVGQTTISDIVHRKSWTHVGATDGE